MERLGKHRFEKHKKIVSDKLYFSNKYYIVTIFTNITLLIMLLSIIASIMRFLPNTQSTFQLSNVSLCSEQDEFPKVMTSNDFVDDKGKVFAGNVWQCDSSDWGSDCVTESGANRLANCSLSQPKHSNICAAGCHYDRGCFASGDNSSVVVERKSRQILYGQNVHLAMGMASTTKIMTALVAIENCPLDRLVKIPKQAVGVEGSSIYLKENELWSVQDLLYGLMLRSGNDAAVALAVEIGGSVDNFVDMMNDRVAAMGLEHTHFTNPHGLSESGHFTSSFDLAMITCEALENVDFARIVSAKSYEVQGNETHPKVVFCNKNKMLGMFEGCDGVKTGYTKATGKCLVSSATRGNMALVCVTLNNPNMWQESIFSLQKAFDEYTLVKVLDKNQDLFVLESGDKKYRFRADNNINIPLKKSDNVNIDYCIDCSDVKTISIDKMQNVGKVYLNINNCLIFCEKISSIDSIKDKAIIKSLPNVVGDGCLENQYGKT